MTALPGNTVKLRRLTKRSQFLNAARGRRAGRAGFTMQAARVADLEAGIGFTVTKKTGNSPERNRIKRRLRAAVQTCAGSLQPQHDYVLVGRRDALSAPFATLTRDLASAIRRLHSSQTDRQRNTHERQ